jgi:hypothetical protein
MLPLLGVVGAAVLMVVANSSGNDGMFLISSVLFAIFGVMYFKR